LAIIKPIVSIQSDEELLKAYQQNLHENALATLYLRYADLLYGVCLKYLKDADASQDAVMNIYSEIVEKLKHHQIENFKGWVYVVAKNHCLMQLRKSKKAITVEFQPQFMQNEDFTHLDDVLTKENDFIVLEKCVQTLQLQQQQAINLFYLQNKCYNDIAIELQMEWNKVRSLIQNGRRNLKICMENNGIE
jgi:RNA polymerase sigma factor (sigma-70 family)